MNILVCGTMNEGKMKKWIEKYGNHLRVIAWLKRNPPPKEWRGTPEEYAYTEMPFAPGWLFG